jgi:AcrR family transcriptional regulator
MAKAASRRRLPPEARREEILLAARKLFSERPYTSVSTADVAEAAGVARSLVHHYFGGIRELMLAVIAHSGAALVDVRTAGSDVPLDERLPHNAAATLDVISENRELWLALAVYGASVDDPDMRALIKAANEQFIQRTLAINSDVISDTPTTRFALRSYNALATEATRAWLMGEQTREDTERLLVTALRNMLLETIPELERKAR